MKLTNLSSLKVLLFPLFLFLLLIIIETINAQQNNISLWKRATKRVISHSKVYPKHYFEKEIIYDTKGNIKEWNSGSVSLTRNYNMSHVRFINGNKNGNPIPQKELKEVIKKINSSKVEDIYQSVLNPFDPMIQKSIKVKNTGKSIILHGKQSTIFTYSQFTKDTVWHGTAWIDTIRGLPLKIVCRPNKIKSTEKNVTIKSLQLVVLYNKTFNHLYGPEKAVTYANFMYTPFPFINFRGRSITHSTFSSYTR